MYKGLIELGLLKSEKLQFGVLRDMCETLTCCEEVTSLDDLFGARGHVEVSTRILVWRFSLIHTYLYALASFCQHKKGLTAELPQIRYYPCSPLRT